MKIVHTEASTLSAHPISGELIFLIKISGELI